MPGSDNGTSGDDDGRARGFFHLSATGRVETFSDGVMAIAITILALEMRTPAQRTSGLVTVLQELWPVYIGYLTSFSYIAVIWLNHHQTFTRVRVVDRGLHAANLVLLFTVAALPFPTAVVSDVLQESTGGYDAEVAVALYALVAAAMCASWLAVYVHLARHPSLLTEQAETHFVRRGQVRAAAGVTGYLVAGALGLLLHPVVAMACFLLLPVLFFVATEGMRDRPFPERAGPGG